MSSAKPLTLNRAGADGEHKYGDMRDYRAPSMFQPHRVREAIRDAHARKIPPMVGMYNAMPSIAVIRWVAPMGYDTIWIDWEHSAMGVETMTTMVHETVFMSEGRTIPFVRVPGHGHAEIAFAMDAGASIVIPQVDTVEQAKHAVSGVRYGKSVGGGRSAPPFRYLAGVTDMKVDATKSHHVNMNQQAALMIQIESEEGVRNLDAILTECPEIDMVWLGRLDARVSMGLAAYDAPNGWNEPEWLEVERIYAETVKKHDKPHSGFSFAEGEGLKKEAGNMAMVVTGGDVSALASLADVARKSKEALKLQE